jgi:hypothetical protein
MQALQSDDSRQCRRLLILTTATSPQVKCSAAARLLGRPLRAVADPGEALRQVVLTHPAVVVVLVAEEGEVDAAASLIAALRQWRPGIPVIALALEPNDGVERRLRGVGASAYVAGSCDLIAGLILTALSAPTREQGATPHGVHGGRSPPVPYRRPTERIRQRPRGASG